MSKTRLIDAICEEGLEGFDSRGERLHQRLKVWKGADLEGEGWKFYRLDVDITRLSTGSFWFVRTEFELVEQ